jgi:hypothetical protein
MGNDTRPMWPLRVALVLNFAAAAALAGGVLAGGPAFAAAPCSHYAAPLQSDGGRVPAGEPYAKRKNSATPDQPIPISDFFDRELAQPGSVLCLTDGLYRGKRSMINPPEGRFSGRPGARISIRAVNDGQVWIDGEFLHRPLRLEGQSYWTVEGLNLYNSVGPVIGIAGKKPEGEQPQVPVEHVVLRRLVAWRDYVPFGNESDYDKIGGTDVQTISLADVRDVLVEDCAGFGNARKIFQNYRSHRVVLRRNWARWDGRYPYRRGNKFAFSCAHKAYDALCENLIATVGGSDDPGAQPSDYSPSVHLIATDGQAAGTSRWLDPPGRDPTAFYLRIHGSLAYVPAGSRFAKVTGFRVGGNGYPHKGAKGVRIENSVVSIAGAGLPSLGLASCSDDPVKHPDGCSWQHGDDSTRAPLVARKITAIGAHAPVASIEKDWRQDDVSLFDFGREVDIYRGRGGSAALCRRSVDGSETSEPLWPWPMQERIRAATERSNWPTADVMGEISEIFGPPPDECRG